MLTATPMASVMASNAIVGAVTVKLEQNPKLEGSAASRHLLTHAPPNYPCGALRE